MVLGIMQPYFFPYIGYWQLINHVDYFILLDDVQFMRHSWIYRNRILKPNGGWQYILVPLTKHHLKEKIKNVCAVSDTGWKKNILAQLEHYRTKARYFDETIQLTNEILTGINCKNISTINHTIINAFCTCFDIKTTVIMASEHEFDYSCIHSPGDWALRISEQMGANEYINPWNGKDLFSRQKFERSDINLSFIKPDDITYNQQGSFEPSLSIIDVLMFNGIQGTKDLLSHYTITKQ